MTFYTIPFYDLETGELIVEKWIVNDNGTIFQYNGTDKDVKIPDEIDGITIDCIGSGVFDGNDITSIEIPDSVTWIDSFAFENCGSLKSVNLSGSMTKLWTYFTECTSLEKIYIPAGIIDIEDGIFTDCPNVTIYGASGSAAEKYAEKNNIPFEVDSALPTPAPITHPDGYEYPYRITSYTDSEERKLTIECYEKNNDAYVIFAGYESDGALVDLNIKKLSADSGERFMELASCSGTVFKETLI